MRKFGLSLDGGQGCRVRDLILWMGKYNGCQALLKLITGN